MFLFTFSSGAQEMDSPMVTNTPEIVTKSTDTVISLVSQIPSIFEHLDFAPPVVYSRFHYLISGTLISGVFVTIGLSVFFAAEKK